MDSVAHTITVLHKLHPTARFATLCYVRTITHREMRNNSAAILREVESGETIKVTNHGRVVAVMSPPHESELDRLIAEGRARPATRPASDLANIKGRKSDVSTAEILDDVRGPW